MALLFILLRNLRGLTTLSLILFCLLFPSLSSAQSVYYSIEDISLEVFKDGAPDAKTLWLQAEQKQEAQRIANMELRQARIKYWQSGDTALWILSDIGKERPITFAVVTRAQKIERIEVMIFREARGDEIRLPAYTAQFVDQMLTDEGKLSRHVDGISGATYSVRTMKRIARLALLLDRWIAPSNASTVVGAE
ncbi:FMN-binding protein [Thalassolituus sp.]|jgi:hypothetical protein|uniref:FMN-binding protein n=1 Tax=Thalassolituus sp. TaxID=2030822 RepID=UPI002A82A74C|nr:FMN-binding protein [Thalassolituus sp.]